LAGPDGLLKALTKTVIETALEEEMSEHLGYDKHEPMGRNRGNSRNGTRTKTVLTNAAEQVDIEVPRDRDGRFEPVSVRKRQRRLSDVDEVRNWLRVRPSERIPRDRAVWRSPSCVLSPREGRRS
jgi:transposase-like protein